MQTKTKEYGFVTQKLKLKINSTAKILIATALFV